MCVVCVCVCVYVCLCVCVCGCFLLFFYLLLLLNVPATRKESLKNWPAETICRCCHTEMKVLDQTCYLTRPPCISISRRTSATETLYIVARGGGGGKEREGGVGVCFFNVRGSRCVRH